MTIKVAIVLDDLARVSLARKYAQAQTSIILQAPFRYAASIGRNLEVGRMGTTQNQIAQAVTESCIDDAILKFSPRYKPQVG